MTRPPPSPEPSRGDTVLLRGRDRRAWMRAAVKLLVVIAALWLASRLLERIDWSALAARTRGGDRPLLALAVGCLLARFALMYLRWSLALRLLERRWSHLFGLASLLAAVVVNHLTPTARLLGGVVRARYLARRSGEAFVRLYATVLLDQLAQQLTQGALTWIALAALAWAVGQRLLAAILLTSLVALAAALAIWRRRRGPGRLAELFRRLGERRARRLGPLFAGGAPAVALLSRGLADRRLQLRMGAIGMAVLGVNGLAQWLIFRSLGSEVAFADALITIAVGLGAGIVSGTPGGVATTEAAMIVTLVALGVDRADAAAGTLVYRGLHYLLVLLLGLPALVGCELSRRDSLQGP